MTVPHALWGVRAWARRWRLNFVRRHSQRKDAVFVPVNCATIPNELIEAELFGYEKGAFTGALKEGKAGLFEVANGGTIFMDEVGELPLPAQAKLLRVLENGEFRRVGGSQVQKTDVRIIAATNRNLKKMVEEKTFRDDLYYRLNVVPVTIPPLRERPEDLCALANLFLAQFNRKHGKARVLSERDLVELQNYSWPGQYPRAAKYHGAVCHDWGVLRLGKGERGGTRWRKTGAAGGAGRWAAT